MTERAPLSYVVPDATNGSEYGVFSPVLQPGDILGSCAQWQSQAWWKWWGPKTLRTLLVEVVQTERGVRIDVTEGRGHD